MAEYGVFAKELALHLDVNPNTLRRWAIELEEQGYQFSRNDKNQRIYYEHDILALTEFQKLIQKTKSLDTTAKAVVSMANEKKNAEKMLDVMHDHNDQIVFTKEELHHIIIQITDEAAERTAEHLLQKLTDIIEKRDRKLMYDMTKSMEQSKLEAAAATVEDKPGFFARLFNKQ